MCQCTGEKGISLCLIPRGNHSLSAVIQQNSRTPVCGHEMLNKTQGNILTFVSIRGVLELSEGRLGNFLPVAKSLGTSFTGPPPPRLDPACGTRPYPETGGFSLLSLFQPKWLQSVPKLCPPAWAGCSEKLPPSCCSQPLIPHCSEQWSASLRLTAARCVG